MKSIVVKSNDSVRVYCSLNKYRIGENGEQIEVEQSDEEQEQQIYQRIIEDAKREEFNKAIISIILGHLSWDKEDCEKISIFVNGKKGTCEMRLSVTPAYKHNLNEETPTSTNP